MSEVKTCKCAAHNYDECVCGAWDDLDPYKLRQDLAAVTKERDELKACLEDLADIQNGTPLIQDGPVWEAIMARAWKLLGVGST